MNYDTSHLDGKLNEVDEGNGTGVFEGETASIEGEVVDVHGGTDVGRENFYLMLNSAFALPGQIIPDLKPLAIQPDEEKIARDASDGIYNIVQIWCPAVLVVNNPTIANLFAAAPFIVGKVAIMMEIMSAVQTEKDADEAHQKRQQPQQQPQAPAESGTDADNVVQIAGAVAPSDA